MTKVLLTLSLLLLLSSPAKANQRASCWPKHNAISQELLLLEDKATELAVEDSGYPAEESRTVLIVEPKKSGHQFTMKFREGFAEVGSPQNVYAVMILGENGQPLLFEDFTGGCKSPGISFFPGQKLNLIRLKSEHLPSEKIHVLLWSQ
ncbi:MAG: hypothetical protein AAF202_09220 [Pseudomonadota bacterium]